MKRRRRSSRRLAAGITALATASLATVGLVMTSGSAAAEPRELTQGYDCPYPLINIQPTKTVIKADIPAQLPVGQPSPEFVINVEADAGLKATEGLNVVGAATIEGEGISYVKLTGPDLDLPLSVPVVIPSNPIPPNGNPLILKGITAKAPSISVPKTGTYTIDVTDLFLKMTPKRADGTPTGLGTFESDCTLQAGQPTQLATIEAIGDEDTQPPTAPGNPQATGTTTDSVSLAWDASTDNVGVTGYDVYNGSTLATSVTGTTATVSGLTPNTSYTFTVKAKDAKNNVSPASAAVTAKTKEDTPPVDTEKPTAPGNPQATGTTTDSVSLAWDASTDNVGVTGYDVYNGST
ncbi:fibronectin type III domain-containing protein, partial [Herbihabitans rhizosphaerae]|uniref:fibronectin type III domain-containing protein n=1 Tax=Herbihabitans rhizosphaerae TaxID=1872711 RepID=UPI001F5F4DDE